MIAILIGYEAVSRLFAPVPIHFAEAIPIAVLGLAVNMGSAWLLSGGAHHHHEHGPGGHHGHDHDTHVTRSTAPNTEGHAHDMGTGPRIGTTTCGPPSSM